MNRKNIIWLLSALIGLSIPAQAAHVCVWNIMADGAQLVFGNGVAPWEERKGGVVDRIQKCDVAFLQEIDDGQSSNQMRNLREWAHNSNRKMCVSTSRFPVFNMRNITIAKDHIPMQCKADLAFQSGRFCQRVTVLGQDAYNCHLDNYDPGNTREVNAMVAMLHGRKNYILAGDMNTNKNLTNPNNWIKINALSVHSNQPLPLDKLIASDLCGRVKIMIPRSHLSDHPGLEARLIPCGLTTAIVNLLLLSD